MNKREFDKFFNVFVEMKKHCEQAKNGVDYCDKCPHNKLCDEFINPSIMDLQVFREQLEKLVPRFTRHKHPTTFESKFCTGCDNYRGSKYCKIGLKTKI